MRFRQDIRLSLQTLAEAIEGKALQKPLPDFVMSLLDNYHKTREYAKLSDAAKGILVNCQNVPIIFEDLMNGFGGFSLPRSNRAAGTALGNLLLAAWAEQREQSMLPFIGWLNKSHKNMLTTIRDNGLARLLESIPKIDSSSSPFATERTELYGAMVSAVLNIEYQLAENLFKDQLHVIWELFPKTEHDKRKLPNGKGLSKTPPRYVNRTIQEVLVLTEGYLAPLTYLDASRPDEALLLRNAFAHATYDEFRYHYPCPSLNSQDLQNLKIEFRDQNGNTYIRSFKEL